MTDRDDVVSRLDPQARQSVERGSEVPSTLIPDRAERELIGDPRSFGQPVSASTLVADRAEREVRDPIRTEAVSKLTVLGLAYAPQLDQRMARIVAERLHDWTGGDPELALLVESDFAEAVRQSSSDWWTRATPFTERLWAEATAVIEEVRGGDWRRQLETELAERNRLAEVAGSDVRLSRIAEMSTGERERFIVSAGVQDAVNAGLSGAEGGLGPAFAAIIRSKVATHAAEDATAVRRAEAAAAARATPEMAMAEIARALIAEGATSTISEASSLSFDLFGQMGEDDQSKLLTDIRTATTAEVVDIYEKSLEDRSAFEEAATDVLGGALDLMTTWDAAAHTIGVTLIDEFVANFGVDTGETPLETLSTEGWDAFRTSFEAMKDGGMAGFYGIDPASAAGSWLNLGSAIIFDPTTWITGGGAAAAKRSVRYMATREGVDAFLSGSRGAMITKAVAATDNVLELAPYLHGMSSGARRRLVTATDPAVVADIIRTEAVDGFWMMNGPALGMRQTAALSAERLGRIIGDTAATMPGGGKVADWVTEMLARRDLTAAVNLGEAGFLDDVTELIVSRFPRDPEKARAVLDDVYRLVEDVEAGGDALAARRVVEAEALLVEANGLRKTAGPAVRRVPKLRASLAEARSELRVLDEQIAGLADELDQVAVRNVADPSDVRTADQIATDVRLADQMRIDAVARIDELTAAVASHGGAFDELVAGQKQLRERAARLRLLNEEAARPRSRAALAQWVDDFMESWAVDIGVPRNADGTIRWAEVRAPGRKTGDTASSVARTAPIEGNRALVADLEAVGALEGGTRHWLKATPLEMSLFKGASEAGSLAALRKAHDAVWTRTLARLVTVANQVWAANLLFNPLNAVKAHLEDIIKFSYAGGPAVASGRALGSPLVDAGRRLLRQPTGGGLRGQFVRQHLAGMVERPGVWQTVESGKPGHFEAAKRWLEGTVLNDESFVVYARSVAESDPRIWSEWWEQVGQYRRRSTTIPIAGTGRARTLDGAAAFDVIDRTVAELARASTDPQAFRRMLLDVASSGKREIPDKLARIAGTMPVERPTAGGVKGTLSLRTFFDVFYGAPARARGGVFYDHYLDTAMGIFEKRFAGRIVDDRLDDIVRAGFARSVVEAEALLRMRSPGLDDWLRQSGLVTRARLEQEAGRWASRHAQSLMYLGGAATTAGAAFAKAAPFAPAQFDFLRWWTTQAKAGTDIALNAPTAAVVGALGRIAGDSAVGRGLQRAATGEIHLPGFNVRLASRWAHLAAESERSGEDRAAMSPVGLVSRFTFLPVDFSDPDNFLVDFVPGLGPIPTWLIHLWAPDDARREALTDLIPSLGWLAGQSSLTDESIARVLLPATTRSLAGQVGWVGRGLVASDIPGASLLERQMADGMMSAVFDWDRRPYGFTDTFKHQLGDLLAAHPDLIPGTARADRLIDETIAQAMDQANAGEFSQRWRAYVGLQSRFAPDANAIQHYAGMMADVDELRPHLGDAQADQLAGWWAQIQAGEITDSDRALFADQAAGALFDLPDAVRDRLIARHPGLAVNMVGTAQCRLNSQGNPVGPAGYCRADGRIDTANPELQGEAGAETRRRGFEEGWFEPRPEVEVAADVIYTAARARRNHLRNLWELLSGRPYADGMVKTLESARFTFDGDSPVLDELAASGLDLPAGTYRGDELRHLFRARLASLPQDEIRVSELPIFMEMTSAAEYRPIVEAITGIEDLLAQNDDPITSFWDWPESIKTAVRDEFAALVTTDPNLAVDYNRWLRPAFGDLDMQPPTPPPVDQLENRFRADPADVVVEDGDTIRLVTRDGDLRVRIIGLNAPEQGQDGYAEAARAMQALIAGASDVVVGQYDPGRFGAVQQVDENAVRLFAWLYIDGVPIFDPAVFTATNPRGAGTGGVVTDLAALLNEGD